MLTYCVAYKARRGVLCLAAWRLVLGIAAQHLLIIFITLIIIIIVSIMYERLTMLFLVY